MRLFFALWPPPDVAARIAQQIETRGIRGQRVARERLHLTLAFYGACDAEQMRALRRGGSGIVVPAFALVLDRVDFFARPAITWFGCSNVPVHVLTLAQRLAPLGVEKHGFRPHVSVSRKSPSLASGAIDPIVWQVDFFSLLASGESDTPGPYRELERWTLA